MNTEIRPLALVTGASGGIGAQIALELARKGHDLVLVARREEALREVAAQAEALGARATLLTADLAKPNAAPELMAELRQRGLRIDLLVNNAGLGDAGPFWETDLLKVEEMLLVNVVALTELTRLLAAEMVARRQGRVLLVSSTAAFQPGPGMAVYFATKAYVQSLGEALAYEFRGTGVTLTTLCPGATSTGFASVAGLEKSALFHGSMVMDAGLVAKCAVRAMMTGRKVIVTGLLNKLSAWSGRFLPRALTLAVAHAMVVPSASQA